MAAVAQWMQPRTATSKTAQKNNLNHVDFMSHLLGSGNQFPETRFLIHCQYSIMRHGAHQPRG